MGNDDPVPMTFSYRDYAAPDGAPASTSPYATEIDASAPTGYERICSRANEGIVGLPDFRLIPFFDSAEWLQVHVEPWSEAEFGYPLGLESVRPKEVGMLEVLSSRTLLARSAKLPKSATLMLAGSSVPITRGQGGVYQVETSAGLVGVSAGQTIAVAQHANTLKAIGSVDAIGVLTSGTCSTAFSVGEAGSAGELQITPPTACSGNLTFVPVAIMGSSATLSSVLGGSGTLSLRLGDPALGTYQVLGAGVLLPEASEWTGALERLVESGVNLASPGATAPTLLLPLPAINLPGALRVLNGFERVADQVEPARRTSLLTKIDTSRVKLTVASTQGTEEITQTLSELQLPSSLARELGKVMDRPGPAATPWNPGPDCGADPLGKLVLGYGMASTLSESARAVFAAEVTRGDGTSMVAYYNRHGEVIRIHERSRHFFDEYEWDSEHNLVGTIRVADDGSAGELGPRTCSSYDDRGLLTSVRRHATDGRVTTQNLAWDQRGPWLTVVSAPCDSGTAIEQRSYDDAGRVLSVVREGGATTSFGYDPEGRLSRIEAPDGSVTTLSDHDALTAQPRTVVRDALGARQTIALTYDAWGHKTSVDPSWGPRVDWTWEDRVRMTVRTVTSESGTFTETWLYNPNGTLSEVEGPHTKIAFRYNDAGWPIKKLETSLENPQDQRLTCWHRRQDGSVRAFVDPLGVAWSEQRTFNGHDVVSKVSLRANTDPGCAQVPEGTEGDPLPSAPVLIETRDGGDRVTSRRDQAGVWTQLAYDGFGRVATIADGAQTTSHTIYDARDRPVARIVNRGAALPPTIDPASLSSVQGLLSATFVTYGSDAQLESSRVYAMGPGGVEPVSAEVFARNYTTNTATRTVNTNAGVLVRTQKWDPLGRLVEDSNNIDQSLKISYPSLDARVLSERGPDGSYIVTTEYLNQFGGVLRRVDGKGSVLIERVVDAFGRTISETAAGGDQVDVTYDVWSRIHAVTERVGGRALQRARQEGIQLRPARAAGLRGPRRCSFGELLLRHPGTRIAQENRRSRHAGPLRGGFRPRALTNTAPADGS